MREKTMQDTVNYDEEYGMSEFAEACCNDNSINELTDAYRQTTADRSDMELWSISAKIWHDSIKSALAYKLSNLVK